MSDAAAEILKMECSIYALSLPLNTEYNIHIWYRVFLIVGLGK